jgi:hypothetical protein
VQFFDTGTFLAQGGASAHLGGVSVGAVPDMVTWTNGGKTLLVANEGERQSDSDNPPGSVSLIDVQRNGGLSTTVKTACFGAFDGQEAALRFLILGESISADEAQRIGLVTGVVDDPLAHATELAEIIANRHSRSALTALVHELNR